MRRRTAHSAAFTLLELVLVLVLLTTVLAMAAPSMRGWSRSTQLKDVAREFIAVANLARTQAISTGKVHRLMVDPSNRRYWLTVQEGQTFVDYPSDLGRPDALSEQYAIQWAPAPGQPARQFIDFYPTGRSDLATIRFESVNGGDAFEVAAQTPTEGFRLVTPGANP